MAKQEISPSQPVPADGPQLGASGSVRAAFLKLLILALVPFLLFGIWRGVVQLQRGEMGVQASLSQRALATAAEQGEIIRTARAVLTMIGDHQDVRSGGILCDLALGRADDGFVAFSNFSRLRADGSMACSSVRPLPTIAFNAQPWWPAAMRGDGFFVTGPEWGPILEKQVLRAVLPLKTESGEFDGIATVAIDLAWMEANLRNRGSRQTALAMALMLDDRGRIVLGDRDKQFPALDVAIGSGTVGTFSDRSERRWTYSVAPIAGTGDGRPSLYVAYAMPEATLFSWSWWEAGLSMAVPLVAVLGVSIVIWFGTNKLVLRWIRELHILARAFARGDYQARAADFSDAPAEVRDLAAAMRRMGDVIEQRDQEMRAAVDYQKQLVHELHHRVKNSLQIVVSLLSMEAGRISSEDGRAAMNQTRLRVSSLALVYRKLYEAGEQASVSSTELLGSVCELIKQALGNQPETEVECCFEDHQLTLDTAIPLSMWLVEAASNALLHAFPRQPGKIVLTLTYADGFGHLEVADNGMGANHSSDAGGESGAKGRGLRMLVGIAKQLRGKHAFFSDANGTRVTLRYPENA